jgi:hypothetical protein
VIFVAGLLRSNDWAKKQPAGPLPMTASWTGAVDGISTPSLVETVISTVAINIHDVNVYFSICIKIFVGNINFQVSIAI